MLTLMLNTVVSARIWLCLYWFDHQYVLIAVHIRQLLTTLLTG